MMIRQPEQMYEELLCIHPELQAYRLAGVICSSEWIWVHFASHFRQNLVGYDEHGKNV